MSYKTPKGDKFSNIHNNTTHRNRTQHHHSIKNHTHISYVMLDQVQFRRHTSICNSRPRPPMLVRTTTVSVQRISSIVHIVRHPRSSKTRQLYFHFLRRPYIRIVVSARSHMNRVIKSSIIRARGAHGTPPRFTTTFIATSARTSLGYIIGRALRISGIDFTPVSTTIRTANVRSNNVSPVKLPSS